MEIRDWKDRGASSEALSLNQQLLNEVPFAAELAAYNYDSEFCFTDEYADMKARLKDCYCEYADDKTLQIDLDSPVVTEEFVKMYDMAHDLGLFDSWGYLTRPSTGGNLHITITMDQPLPVERRILLQALLGSDIKREMLSLAGLLKGRQVKPVLFFRHISERPAAQGRDDVFTL